MRVEPSITFTGTLRENTTWSVLSKGSDTNATTENAMLQCTGSGMTSNRPSMLVTGDASGNVIFEAEL